jgi:peptidoglycan/xylan/chitin deacetylase (PgdA/CDA1 family)
VVCAVLVVGVWLVLTQPPILFALLERVTPNLVWRVPTDQPLVALSFDDGPDPANTPKVLEILKSAGATATFFLIGERALAHPDLVRRIKAEGHEVGNHYISRTHTSRHSDADFLDSLDRTERALDMKGAPKLFRPPGGISPSRHLRPEGIPA